MKADKGQIFEVMRQFDAYPVKDGLVTSEVVEMRVGDFLKITRDHIKGAIMFLPLKDGPDECAAVIASSGGYIKKGRLRPVESALHLLAEQAKPESEDE